MTATTETHLEAEKAGGVLTLTLNRPDSLNSLTTALIDDLRAAVEAAETDPEVRCIVITGAGRGFSSGAALKGVEGDNRTLGEVVQTHYNPLIELLRRIEKPVIASLNGVTAGAGAGIALACDFRVMSEKAKIALLFVRIGLVPDAGGTYLLAKLIGTSRATEILMLGEDVLPDKALEIGLVHRVAAPEDLDAVTGELAARLAAGPKSVGMIKRQLRGAENLSLADGLQLEADTQTEAGQTSDFGEGVMAFIEKRPAKFTGS